MNPFGAGTLIVIPSISNVDKYPEFISLVETVDDTLSIFGGFFFALMYITVAEIIEPGIRFTVVQNVIVNSTNSERICCLSFRNRSKQAERGNAGADFHRETW
jgi:hypothetical protein